MKYLIADLVEKLASQEASTVEAFVQLDAIEIIVMALFAQLDEQSKLAIRENVSLAFEKINDEAQADPTELERLRRATFNLLDRDITLPLSRIAS
ncbi:hypothetical protein CG28_003978 [Salmonella enterica subsp. enterica serovar Ohio]|uniref:sigma-S stabilization anti-adapter protein IraP n=1 Tax=Enterobacteriaceae TaxID=543 RepID=UPI001271C10D|nr:sigma-S stabilization anti-adapter protein IraP [Salmonella enterica]EAW1169461.1 hypothetical protein [Salmonella enterica subsp. enterica]EBV6770623.1 hypothetical protein [Salmonella enterica subsp. enterica serovar Ohio]ECA7317415.1 hypothetical protein [Salmonella enterica subsp. enterica serovar Thompson]EFH5128259.1 hypothetical protein [Escherichia coli]EHK7909229.1 hypothetical protein [Salmonella enterica subsp. enterica serovar Senftenberg]